MMNAMIFRLWTKIYELCQNPTWLHAFVPARFLKAICFIISFILLKRNFWNAGYTEAYRSYYFQFYTSANLIDLFHIDKEIDFEFTTAQTKTTPTRTLMYAKYRCLTTLKLTNITSRNKGRIVFPRNDYYISNNSWQPCINLIS